MNPNRIGLLFGVLLGLWHLIWTSFVFVGWAQPVMDSVFWAHMIQPVYTIKAFDPKAAVALVLITFMIGYTLGFIGALLWNNLHQAK